MGLRVRLRCGYRIYVEIPGKQVEIQHWSSGDVLLADSFIHSTNIHY